MVINLKLNKNEVKKVKTKFQSLRVKLFLTLCITIIVIIFIMIIVNTMALETYYIHSKEASLVHVYNEINKHYNQQTQYANLELELERIAQTYDFEILIRTEKNIYTSNRDFLSTFQSDEEKNVNESTIYRDDGVTVSRIIDNQTGLSYILLSAKLDNGYILFIRTALASIEESTGVANRFLMIMGLTAIPIIGLVSLIMARKITEPIEKLNKMTEKISVLDFSHKYEPNDSEDELNNLGKNINAMSERLERTINELKESNIELEKGIEEKSRIDEMRTQFISDVSHELKTPIALIQGYAEGLAENVIEDEESRKFYVEVILDEANKMDVLVKKLLELMKLEYGKNVFHQNKFNMSELINEVIRKSTKMLQEENITVNFEAKEVFVLADEFYADQAFSNYFTNAMKNVLEIDGKKEINISYEIREDKLRVKVFNTGENIASEDLNRIWKRFYKVDESRNRNKRRKWNWAIFG